METLSKTDKLIDFLKTDQALNRHEIDKAIIAVQELQHEYDLVHRELLAVHRAVMCPSDVQEPIPDDTYTVRAVKELCIAFHKLKWA